MNHCVSWFLCSTVCQCKYLLQVERGYSVTLPNQILIHYEWSLWPISNYKLQHRLGIHYDGPSQKKLQNGVIVLVERFFWTQDYILSKFISCIFSKPFKKKKSKICFQNVFKTFRWFRVCSSYMIMSFAQDEYLGGDGINTIYL